MRIPAVWLREFIPVPEAGAELQAFCDALTMAGLEVEEILDTPIGPTLYTKITPNRGDWASVYGTAREAVATLPALSLKPMADSASTNTSAPLPADFASVTIDDPDNCPRYAAKIIRGVTIGPAPDWIRQRLEAALGDKYRPVNNVADITNYVMLELGQPLHAFDLDTLQNGEIVVRQANTGETLTTLDGMERTLSPGMLCICDHEKPVAIAGIMGGAATEITSGTVNVLLESAHFDPLSVRRTTKRLGLKSEASYRFERFVDPALVPIAAERAAQLIVECAGGVALPGLIDVVAKKPVPRRVLARIDRIRQLLGVDVERDAAIAGLERLGLTVERSGTAMDCGIPSWRPDLAIEDDIAEEVGRIALGYENLPATPPPVQNPQGGDSLLGRFKTKVRETLVRAGFQELQSHSLVSPSALFDPAESETQVHLRSPRAPEFAALRTSLLPGQMAVAARAMRDGMSDIAVFEVGAVYQKASDGAYREPLRVSGLCAGSAMPAVWNLKGEAYPVDLYYAKGAVEELLQALGIAKVTFAAGEHSATHPGRTATITAGDTLLGIVGELSEQVVAAHDLPRRTYVLDLDGDALAASCHRYDGALFGPIEVPGSRPRPCARLRPIGTIR